MDSYLLDESRKIHICGNNPDCAGYAHAGTWPVELIISNIEKRCKLRKTKGKTLFRVPSF